MTSRNWLECSYMRLPRIRLSYQLFTDANVIMCRQLCDFDCLRCCKCCVYFDLRMGRRSAPPKTDDGSSSVHPHQRKPTTTTIAIGPAAANPPLAKRGIKRLASRRLSAVSTLLSLLLLSVSRDSSSPQTLASCSRQNVDVHDDLPTSIAHDMFGTSHRGVLL